MLKKPRLQHTDLPHSDLTPKERQHKWIRQWLSNEKSDPVRALEIKDRNTAKKRAWRKHKREEMEKIWQTTCTSIKGNPPQKWCQASPTEAYSNIAGPSNSAHDSIPTAKTPSGPSNSMHEPIPIDPVLLNQEAPIVTGAPHLMCDVKVMTDTPDSLIHSPSHLHVQTSPSLTLSVLTDLDSCDLSTSIIGSQVHEQLETVQWCNGSTTVLPCINICQEDANGVSFFASLPESLPEMSQSVVHLWYSDWCSKSQQLCDEISSALHQEICHHLASQHTWACNPWSGLPWRLQYVWPHACCGTWWACWNSLFSDLI